MVEMKRLVAICCMVLFVAIPKAQSQSVKEHSATTALCLSIIPGGGQIYNHQAWKIPIIYGAFAGMGYFVYDNYSNMQMFKQEYLRLQREGGSCILDGYTGYPTSSIYSLYNSYNQNFQLMVIITVGIYALNLIDAYVFGHLFSFQMDDNLAVAPSVINLPTGCAPTLGLTLNI